ncbi:MAG: GNAT family N-acetyltransferase [Oscillospiraceae bacterium]|nr:GNAT family N-acetyltransferase [Oscillospiraceae bacterium]
MMTETENLLLRNWQKSDAAALYQMCRDETLRRSGAAFFESIHDAEEAIRFWEKDSRFKAIIHRESGESIGFISLGDMNRYEGYMELVIVVIGDGSVCHTFVTLLFSFCEFAVHLRKTQLWSVASGGLLSRRGESRQRHARGDLFRGGPLWTPSPTTKGAPPPLDSPLLDERREFMGTE